MKFLNVIKSRNGRKIHFEKIEHKIEKICKEQNINLLYLYGSYRQGVAYKSSDIDIGFLGEKRFELQQTLYLLNKLQDVFEEEAIDLVDLSKAPLTLIHQVLKEGRCLYAKSIRIKIEFEIRYEALYFDTEPLRREYFKALERRIKMVPSGIDREKIMLQLGRLEEHLSRLKEIKDKLKDLPEDNILLSSAERLLQISIEYCLNIGSHIIAGLGLVRADTYREIFTRLKEANIIKEELGTKMEQFASFRNRLVHLYWEVSRDGVISQLQEIESLKEFAQAVLKCIENLKTQP